MLNGCRVNVRHSEFTPNAINAEASKKSVSIVCYENCNYDFVFELPHLNEFSGGVARTIELAKELSKKYKVHIRIQKPKEINLSLDHSIGLPSNPLPKTKYIITYSDNPYTDDLVKNNQEAKIFILMLSYGMCLERERKNILNKNLTVLTSTKRTKKLIEKEGVKCNYIGFSYNDNFYQEEVKKENIAVVYYAPQPDKNYQLAVKVCNKLIEENLIDGCISFGIDRDYENFTHPNKLKEHHKNANKETIRNVFSRSSIFIMPSKTEGLNRTPLESTLCGCPAVICDGAIDDIFFDSKTCMIAKHSFEDIFEKSKKLILNPDRQQLFKKNIEYEVKKFTLENTISNLEKFL